MKKSYPTKGYPKPEEGIRNLPVFKGYFVDARLKQFRRVKVPALTDEVGIEEYYAGISFTSMKGRELLAEIQEKADHDENVFRLFLEIGVLIGAFDFGPDYAGLVLDWGPPVGSL